MSAVGWGGDLTGWGSGVEQEIADLQANQANQAASIQSMANSIVSAYYVYGRGSASGQAIASGATVRYPLPAISEHLPNDARWNRNANGVYEYDGGLAGVYDILCVINFGVSVGTLQTYTFTLAEGTGLDTGSPVVRDSLVYNLPVTISVGGASAVALGPLTLHPFGGQLALFVQHSALVSVTLTPSAVIPFFRRIDPVPAI